MKKRNGVISLLFNLVDIILPFYEYRSWYFDASHSKGNNNNNFKIYIENKKHQQLIIEKTHKNVQEKMTK